MKYVITIETDKSGVVNYLDILTNNTTRCIIIDGGETATIQDTLKYLEEDLTRQTVQPVTLVRVQLPQYLFGTNLVPKINVDKLNKIWYTNLRKVST